MDKPKTLLSVSSDTEVLDWDLAPQKFCVAGLIPKGLSILGGAPKIGKSWFVLDLCLRVSRGELSSVRKRFRAKHSTCVWRTARIGCIIGWPVWWTREPARPTSLPWQGS